MTGREGQLTARRPLNTPQLLPQPPDGALGTERLSDFSEATQPGGGRAGGSNPEAHSSFQHANRQGGPGKIAISCPRGLGEEVEAAVGGCWEPLITPFWGTPVSLPDPAGPWVPAGSPERVGDLSKVTQHSGKAGCPGCPPRCRSLESGACQGEGRSGAASSRQREIPHVQRSRHRRGRRPPESPCCPS